MRLFSRGRGSASGVLMCEKICNSAICTSDGKSRDLRNFANSRRLVHSGEGVGAIETQNDGLFETARQAKVAQSSESF